MRVINRSLTLFAAALALACGADSTAVPGPDRSASETSGSGGSDTSSHTPPSTSNGTVASVTLTPKQVTLPIGYYAHLVARPADANGTYVAGKRAQWRSSDAAVTVASDTGVVYGKALG